MSLSRILSVMRVERHDHWQENCLLKHQQMPINIYIYIPVSLQYFSFDIKYKSVLDLYVRQKQRNAKYTSYRPAFDVLCFYFYHSASCVCTEIDKVYIRAGGLTDVTVFAFFSKFYSQRRRFIFSTRRVVTNWISKFCFLLKKEFSA